MAYNLLLPVHVINAVSMGSNITSSAIEVKNQDNVGLQLVWTGAPVGVFSVQISLNHKEDLEGNIVVAGTWATLPLSPSIAAAGSADNAYIDINQTSAQYIRLVYTRTSGTGTLDAYIDAKGV